MNKIKCLLVDDEPPAIQLLEKHISMIDQLEISEKSFSAVNAFDILKTKKIDLMFLDICMPVLNGMDFIKTLKNPPAIILTTAYREYAIDGYDLDVIDYLLKPISFNRFLKAVDRYKERVNSHPTKDKLNTPNLNTEHIYLNVNRTHHKVILSEIMYIESLKDYVRIHMPDSRLVVKGNIGSFMKLVPNDQFVRIHRSFAIATSKIQSYNQKEVQICGKKLAIGASYREAFMEHLNQM